MLIIRTEANVERKRVAHNFEVAPGGILRGQWVFKWGTRSRASGVGRQRTGRAPAARAPRPHARTSWVQTWDVLGVHHLDWFRVSRQLVFFDWRNYRDHHCLHYAHADRGHSQVSGFARLVERGAGGSLQIGSKCLGSAWSWALPIPKITRFVLCKMYHI